MKLVEQILSEFGGEGLNGITLVPDKCCYLKSVKSVLSFSPVKIMLVIGRFSVFVEGENMTVGEYFEGDLMIKGNVRCVRVE